MKISPPSTLKKSTSYSPDEGERKENFGRFFFRNRGPGGGAAGWERGKGEGETNAFLFVCFERKRGGPRLRLFFPAGCKGRRDVRSQLHVVVRGQEGEEVPADLCEKGGERTFRIPRKTRKPSPSVPWA